MKKIIICGGHLTPAIALVESLEKRKDLKVFFFTRKSATEGSEKLSAEFTEAQKHNMQVIKLTGGRIQRRFTSHTIPALVKIPLTFIETFYQLLKIRPNIVVAVGGSLSFPVVFNAWLIGIPSTIHEQAVEPGLSNRLNALFAKKIFVTWPDTLKFFQGDKTELIGNLVRPSTESKSKNSNLTKALNSKKPILLVTGGNQGSHFLNNLVFNSISTLERWQIIHLLGTTNYKGDHQKAEKIKYTNYSPFEYLNAADMAEVYKKAKIVISRSGANTVWDLATLGKVSILIPLPFAAGNEQYKNAKVLEKAGSATIVDEKEANSAKIGSILKNTLANYQKQSKSAQSLQMSLDHGALQKMTHYLDSF